MKKRFLALGIAILLTAAVLFGQGIYLKYWVLKPLGLGQEESALALPFLLMTDDGLRYAIRQAQQTEPSLPPETTAPPAETTEPPTAPPTNPPTEPPATTVPETVPETTSPETTPPETTDDGKRGVDESWYDDVLFIGDSRTCGLRDFARSGNADYFCKVGMTVFGVTTEQVEDKNFSKQTLQSLLKSKTYGKIFINLGLNECGYPIDPLIQAFSDLIDQIHEIQPDAVIIIQGIMTVSRGKAASASYFAISNLQKINQRLSELADWKTVYYIDVNSAFADEEGYLPSQMSSDGCHLYAKYYVQWAEWISYAAGLFGI